MSGATKILVSLGAAMAAAFPDHEIIYGLPVDDGTFVGAGKLLRVHMMQETGTLQSQSFMGGKESVSPILAISISQPISSTNKPTSIERVGARWDLAAELRSAISAWILSTRDAPIDEVGTVSYVDHVATPSSTDLGSTTGTESVTIQTTIRYTRNAGAA